MDNLTPMKNFYLHIGISVVLTVLTIFAMRTGDGMTFFKSFFLGFMAALIVVSITIATLSFLKARNGDSETIAKPSKPFNKLPEGNNDISDEDLLSALAAAEKKAKGVK